jgi:hypothetical protein
LNNEKIWKIQKKGKLNSEKIGVGVNGCFCWSRRRKGEEKELSLAVMITNTEIFH